MRHLVPRGQDLRYPVRVALGHAAGDEERLAQTVAGQQLEDQRHRHLRAVGALREQSGKVGVLGVVADPHLLRVEVEGEGDRAARAVRPVRHGGETTAPRPWGRCYSSAVTSSSSRPKSAPSNSSTARSYFSRPHSQKSKSMSETPSWMEAHNVQPYLDISPHSRARATLLRSGRP